MARVLMPLPSMDFDPTEAAIPWRMLKSFGHEVWFATPDGKPAAADPCMVTAPDPAIETVIAVAAPDAMVMFPGPATRASTGPDTDCTEISPEPLDTAASSARIGPVEMPPDPSTLRSADPAAPTRISPAPA